MRISIVQIMSMVVMRFGVVPIIARVMAELVMGIVGLPEGSAMPAMVGMPVVAPRRAMTCTVGTTVTVVAEFVAPAIVARTASRMVPTPVVNIARSVVLMTGRMRPIVAAEVTRTGVVRRA